MQYFTIMYKVLVPLGIYHPRPGTRAPMHFARLTYIQPLVRRNLQPVFVSGAMSLAMIADAYAQSDALLYMGGGDFNAQLYGQTNHPSTDCSEPSRDVIEIALARMAVADRKPFLGICRGAQALAIAAGGTLHQNLPDLGLSEEHGIGEGNGYDHLLVREGHAVALEQGSLIHRTVGQREVVMNSGHHQSVASVGPLLRISGRTAAGVAEFIEHRDPSYFCLGVQGHPEVDGAVADRIFDAFARAMR